MLHIYSIDAAADRVPIIMHKYNAAGAGL